VNRLSVILLLAVSILLLTAMTLVVVPYRQFAAISKEEKLSDYTTLQQEGRDQYVSLGCVYCHSQQPRDPAFAPDGERGWGRPSTPGDYAYDYPHQLGTMRTGPDLFNVGARLPEANWHYAHLYQPRSLVPNSVMPSYPFLFEKKERAAPGDVVVKVPGAPMSGVLVARPEAKALVAYLQSLDHTYPSNFIDTIANEEAKK